MSIDMRSYSGELDPAAVDQPVDSSSSLQEDGEFVNQEVLAEIAAEQRASKPTEEQPNPQAENFRALREEVDRMKAERDLEKREYQAQIDMLKANSASKESLPKERRFLEGMNDDDIPSVAELRREMEARESAYLARIEELQVSSRHPDYAEVIEKYAIPLVKEKPHLAEGLQGARNKALFAYELGKMAQRMNAPQPAVPSINETAQRIVENSRKPGTLSQVGGSGALSKADYIATMSDKEFYNYALKNLDGI